jgi:methionine--tRNA ligase beta chain
MKIEMTVGRVVSAEPVEGSEKLLKLSVDFAEVDETGAPKHRQVLSGIAKSVKPEDIAGKLMPFVTNLPPRAIMGMESQAMILVACDNDGVTPLIPMRDVPPGSKLS